ncbi:hypothetical protein ABIA00_003851 [Bradyrhizobium ottawaense]
MLGEEAFEIRIDGVVVLRHRVPARLRMPRSFRGAAGEDRRGGRPLHGIKLPGLLRLHAIGEIFQEGVFRKFCVAVALDDAGAHRAGRELLRQRDEILIRIGRTCGDINEAGDLRIGADLADHRAAPGMRDQHGRSVLLGQRALGGLDRVRKRRQRILHGRDMQARGLEDRDHLRPARAVGPGAMHQHDVLCFHRLRCLRVSEAEGGRQQARGDEKAAPK